VTFRFLLAALCAAGSVSTAIPAQTAPPAGCTQDKNLSTCDAPAFAADLRNARTVAIETRPLNQGPISELGNLVRSLGKAPASGPQADLTFVLVKIDYAGVNFGPGDRELASLRVYAQSSAGSPGTLIWVEPFRGQPDLAWPVVVRELIQQFRADVKGLPH